MAVFVVDQHHQPLMPCSEKRARHLLSRKRAVVHRLIPFTLRLKDRRRETAQVQAVALKLDPGSKTTGMALVRIEKTQQGELHHAVHLADLAHRGQQVRKGMLQRASYRRRRRSANLRYRPARFKNRVRLSKWLPPALGLRLGNVLTWVQRYRKWIPISRLEVESVKFDPARLKNPELTGVAYQRGELFGWEIRAYLLEKFQRRCVYCGCADTAFEIDHVVPRSRGGSDAVSNLVLSCHDCNAAKGNRTGAEFDHPEVEAKARLSLGEAAAMNATRYALVDRLEELGLPVGTWSGGRTRWNRERFGIQKEHCLDALCVGELVGVRLPALRRLQIMAKGRGSHQRTNVDATGFPRGYLTRQKRIRSFSTGDLVRAEVPGHLKTAGVHVGRVAVRMSGFFRIGKTDGINAKYCHLLQRTDGYEYARA